MNLICAKPIESFGRDIIAVHIDGVPIDQFLCDLTGDSFYRDLWCAWLLNGVDNDSRYIWTLLNEKRECNLPILLCPDDMDFWCTVIVAKVSFSSGTVTWSNIGAVTEKIDVVKWRESGIQNIASWSDSDWKTFGDALSSLNADDDAWAQWWSENWLDEENRRIWNYFDPFFNNDKNMKWLHCPALTFETSEYDACVSAFKQFQY